MACKTETSGLNSYIFHAAHSYPKLNFGMFVRGCNGMMYSFPSAVWAINQASLPLRCIHGYCVHAIAATSSRFRRKNAKMDGKMTPKLFRIVFPWQPEKVCVETAEIMTPVTPIVAEMRTWRAHSNACRRTLRIDLFVQEVPQIGTLWTS